MYDNNNHSSHNNNDNNDNAIIIIIIVIIIIITVMVIDQLIRYTHMQTYVYVHVYQRFSARGLAAEPCKNL